MKPIFKGAGNMVAVRSLEFALHYQLNNYLISNDWDVRTSINILTAYIYVLYIYIYIYI